MNEDYPICPDWRISQWFNTAEAPTLEKLRGQIIVLHFFQMLCPGCVSHALPQAEMLHRRLGNSGVRVIGVHSVFEHHTAMTPVALEAFIHEYRLTFPIGVDQAAPNGSIPLTMQAYRLHGTPSLILIDPKGRMRKHAFGRVEDFEVGFELGKLINEQKLFANTEDSETGDPPHKAACDENSCANR